VVLCHHVGLTLDEACTSIAISNEVHIDLRKWLSHCLLRGSKILDLLMLGKRHVGWDSLERVILIEARLIVDVIMIAGRLVESRGRKVAAWLLHILLRVIKLCLLSVEAVLGIHVGAEVKRWLIHHLLVLVHN
jgi:hypothetical protein